MLRAVMHMLMEGEQRAAVINPSVNHAGLMEGELMEGEQRAAAPDQARLVGAWVVGALA